MIYISAKNEIDPTNGLGGFRENRTRSNSTEKLYLCHVELKIGNFHEYSKGSFIITDIFGSVQIVRFFLPPSPPLQSVHKNVDPNLCTDILHV